MSSRTLTYEDLKKKMLDRTRETDEPAAGLGNLQSALAGFLRERGIQWSEPIGSTLRGAFHRKLAAHIEALDARGAPSRYVANRKSLLRRWHRLVVSLDTAEAAARGTASPFLEALRLPFLEGARVRTTAKAVGMPIATLKRWLKGAKPQHHAIRYLTRLERLFGMPENALVSLLEPYGSNKRHESGVVIPYRKQLSIAIADPYRLRPQEAKEHFTSQWRALLRFRTTDHFSWNGPITDEPQPAGRRWRLTALDPGVPLKHEWIDVIDGKKCETAKISFEIAASFFGWLKRTRERGGAGWSSGDVQTLGHFANREAARDYIRWRIERAGGIISGGVLRVARFAAALCRPESGFLPNHPEIGRTVGVDAPQEWLERCRLAHRFFTRMVRELASKEAKSRDPTEPIKTILQMDNPMQAIVEAVERLVAERPATIGVKQALWARDRLLFLLPLSNPLRAGNLKRLTYRPDGTGHLRRDATGAWRICIPRPSIKTAKPYEAPVSRALWDEIALYLREYRPLLAQAGNDYFFPSTRTRVGPWIGLNRRYEWLTRRYLPMCAGFGPHSFRHIVATALERGGNSMHAADALHDRQDTVKKHYVHGEGSAAARMVDELFFGPRLH